MRTIRFHAYGDPLTVLAMEHVEPIAPGPGRIRVAVRACGLNPADWALCNGFFPGTLPRGIGFEVSGIVDAVGEGVSDVAIGDAAFGWVDLMGQSSAGAADLAIMDHWEKIPDGLDFIHAAALPMAVTTAVSHLEAFGLKPGMTLMVNGGGTTVGFAAVQVGLRNGVRVIASAGESFAGRLRDMGASVTPYGEGMVERVKELAGDHPIDMVFETSPVSGAIPELIRIAGDDPSRVLAITDHDGAAKLGARSTVSEKITYNYKAMGEYALYAAKGEFDIPVAGTFPLEDWRSAVKISQGKHPHGKLILIVSEK